MLKTISAIALGSALLLAPAVALADMTTTPPSPYTAKEPGNGPTVYRHHWRHNAYNNAYDDGMVEQRSAAEEPMYGGPGYRYDAGGVWSGPSYSPYANMYQGPAPQQ